MPYRGSSDTRVCAAPYRLPVTFTVGEGLAPPETFPIISLYHAEHINLSVGYGACDVPKPFLSMTPKRGANACFRREDQRSSENDGRFIDRKRWIGYKRSCHAVRRQAVALSQSRTQGPHNSPSYGERRSRNARSRHTNRICLPSKARDDDGALLHGSCKPNQLTHGCCNQNQDFDSTSTDLDNSSSAVPYKTHISFTTIVL